MGGFNRPLREIIYVTKHPKKRSNRVRLVINMLLLILMSNYFGGKFCNQIF